MFKLIILTGLVIIVVLNFKKKTQPRVTSSSVETKAESDVEVKGSENE